MEEEIGYKDGERGRYKNGDKKLRMDGEIWRWRWIEREWKEEWRKIKRM